MCWIIVSVAYRIRSDKGLMVLEDVAYQTNGFYFVTVEGKNVVVQSLFERLNGEGRLYDNLVNILWVVMG